MTMAKPYSCWLATLYQYSDKHFTKDNSYQMEDELSFFLEVPGPSQKYPPPGNEPF